MKILVITQIYPQPDDVGDDKPTRTVEYFAKEWVEAGHEVVVFHCPSRFPILAYCLPNGVRNWVSQKANTFIPPLSSIKKIRRNEFGIHIYRYPFFKLYPGKAYSKNSLLRYSKKICVLLEEIAFIPDLVMGHFANPSLEVVANIADHFHCKSSIVFHHDCGEKNIRRYRIAENIGRVKAVGARSITEAREMQDLLNLKKLPFICYSGVPNSIVADASSFCDRHDFSNHINHLFVGGMIKRKCLRETIVAYDTVYKNDPRATFKIIGGGPEENSIKDLLSGLKNESIVLLGTKPRDVVQQEMKKANVLTMISENETFGMVYVEAMLQGCIVIASYKGGFDGIIQDGVNGFLCKPGDSIMLEAVYRRINALSVKERNEIGNNAIQTANKLSERDVALRYLNDVIERNG